MGYRQSMVVLNGWYLYQNSKAVNTKDRLCQAIKLGLNLIYVYWADVEMYGYADPKNLTPLPEGLNNLLLSSNTRRTI